MKVIFDLDQLHGALADCTRRAILARLASGEASVTELAQPFEMTQPSFSRHIKVLCDAGLIVKRIDGTWRRCRLVPEALAELDAWITKLRDTVAANYGRLDDLLAEEAPAKIEERP